MAYCLEWGGAPKACAASAGVSGGVRTSLARYHRCRGARPASQLTMSGRPRMSGFALIAVLWLVAGLAAIAMEAMIAARDQVRVAARTRDAAIAQAAADRAVRHAAFELIRGAWRYSGPPRPIRIGQTAVDVIV